MAADRKRSTSPMPERSSSSKRQHLDSACGFDKDCPNGDDEAMFQNMCEQFTLDTDLVFKPQLDNENITLVEQQQEEQDAEGEESEDEKEQTEDSLLDLFDKDDSEDAIADGLNMAEDCNDLFAKTFGSVTSEEKGDSFDDHEANEQFGAYSNTKDVPLTDYAFLSEEHSVGCRSKHIRRSNTPPSSSSRGSSVEWLATSKMKSQPSGPDTLLSRAYRAHKRFHDRALYLIPRLSNREGMYEWPKCRYWIAVFIMDKSSTKKEITEKDFIWMKGNRLTTVKTVWNSYQLTTMTSPEDLVLLFGEETVEMTDQAEELDVFDDRLVVFRAVSKHRREGKADCLVDGLVPEVIEIDDD